MARQETFHRVVQSLRFWVAGLRFMAPEIPTGRHEGSMRLHWGVLSNVPPPQLGTKLKFAPVATSLPSAWRSSWRLRAWGFKNPGFYDVDLRCPGVYAGGFGCRG